MQKAVTFDDLFNILGGDLPLHYFKPLNQWHLKFMEKKRKNNPEIIIGNFTTNSGRLHTLKTWDYEVRVIRKFQILLAKLTSPSDNDPDWPNNENLSEALEHVLWIYKMNEFERDLFTGIPEPLSTFDRGTKEYWLRDLYYNYTSPLKNKQAREEISLQIAKWKNHEQKDIENTISDDLKNFDDFRQAWKLRELCHAWDHPENGDASAYRYWKAYGCAEGKGNAAENAIKEWKTNGGFEKQSDC